MFTQYDEYQRLMRYKNGYYAFHLLNILLFLNMFVTNIMEVQWAQDQWVEFSFIIAIPIMFMNIRNTWQGSYLNRNEKPSIANTISLIMGLAYFWLATRGNYTLMQDGLLTLQAPQILFGLVWISTPLTYYGKYFVDKFSNEK